MAGARGRTLDLDSPGALERLLSAATAATIRADDCFDTIISTCRLIDVADLGAATRAMARLLSIDGELHLVEPVNHVGPMGMVLSSVGSRLPRASGLHISRDVVGAVRATGLSVADVDRFIAQTWIWPLRPLVQIRAVRVASANDRTSVGAGGSLAAKITEEKESS